MGRKWANIKEKKAAKDANNSRVYAKFGIEDVYKRQVNYRRNTYCSD